MDKAVIHITPGGKYEFLERDILLQELMTTVGYIERVAFDGYDILCDEDCFTSNASSLVVWNVSTKSDVSSVTKAWMPLTTLSSHLSKFTKLTLTSTIS